MSLKTSFASVLRAVRAKRNISQRAFGDTASRTFLSKLESGRSSPTLDKLEQISERLGLSPLTLLTLTICADSGVSVADLLKTVSVQVENLGRDGGVTGLELAMRGVLPLCQIASEEASVGHPPVTEPQGELALSAHAVIR